jgi:UDP-2-acetamido-2-deoxy-ribo-hexuluronate aminotransferase
MQDSNTMVQIQMVDLKAQYEAIKPEIDAAIREVLTSTAFINGPQVANFAAHLQRYLDVPFAIPCANGTDALQIALMALGLQPGDEVIVPAFTYVATAEVIALLKLTPVMIDVDPESFMLTAEAVEQAITPRTRAIVPVHLFGQCAPMDAILAIADRHNLFVVEDTAQALGAVYTFPDGRRMRAGTMGHIGCTSFFPSKNLGCYGDGGALFTRDAGLAENIRKIANHGQRVKYYHEVVGVNSRLDTLQAAILDIKLTQLDRYESSRNQAARFYDAALQSLDWLQIPQRLPQSSHVFHQYTLRLNQAADRDALKNHLQQRGIPSMVYYPVPLHLQEAFRQPGLDEGAFPVAEQLCSQVLSLPIHTEMDEEQLNFIVDAVKSFK